MNDIEYWAKLLQEDNNLNFITDEKYYSKKSCMKEVSKSDEDAANCITNFLYGLNQIYDKEPDIEKLYNALNVSGIKDCAKFLIKNLPEDFLVRCLGSYTS